MKFSISREVNPVRKVVNSGLIKCPSVNPIGKPTLSNGVKILSLSFLFIFLGLNGVQSYITPFFSEMGLFNVGFYSLILIYLFFTLSNPLSAVFVSRYGAKKCMLIGSLFYSLFVLSLVSKSTILIYITSSLVGIAASLLWTGQNSYLIRASDEKTYGTASGFFNSFLSFGSAIGVFVLGFLIASFLFEIPFLLFSIFPLIGFGLLFKLKDLRAEQKLDHFKLIKKSILSITALRLSGLWFAVNFIFGLIIGIIPIQIKNTLGVSYIGVLISLFYILPIILSYFFGKLSDIKGRKQMIIISYILLIVGLLSLSFPEQPLLLAFGIILLALNWTIIKPVTYALVGDVSTKQNLEFLTALFWMVQNIGVLSALLLSQIFKAEIMTLYLISILLAVISLIILLPLLRLKIEKIKEKLAQEVS